MRFATKFDTWLLVALGISFLLTFLYPAATILIAFVRHESFPGIFVFCVAAWLITIPATLPQYYEFRSDGLFIRRGWRKTLLPYASLIQVHPLSSTSSAGVFSSDRILILANDRRYLIAPRNKSRFLEELASRVPQLEQKGTDLGTLFSVPS